MKTASTLLDNKMAWHQGDVQGAHGGLSHQGQNPMHHGRSADRGHAAWRIHLPHQHLGACIVGAAQVGLKLRGRCLIHHASHHQVHSQGLQALVSLHSSCAVGTVIAEMH